MGNCCGRVRGQSDEILFDFFADLPLRRITSSKYFGLVYKALREDSQAIAFFKIGRQVFYIGDRRKAASMEIWKEMYQEEDLILVLAGLSFLCNSHEEDILSTLTDFFKTYYTGEVSTKDEETFVNAEMLKKLVYLYIYGVTECCVQQLKQFSDREMDFQDQFTRMFSEERRENIEQELFSGFEGENISLNEFIDKNCEILANDDRIRERLGGIKA